MMKKILWMFLVCALALFIVSIAAQVTVLATDTIISVLDCGANGIDDGADDTAAFASALALAGPGVTIRVPEGVYKITNGFTFSSNTKLIGDGMGKSVINYIYLGGDSNYRRDYLISMPEGTANVLISGITIDCKNNSVKRVIEVLRSVYITIDGVGIKNNRARNGNDEEIGIYMGGRDGDRTGVDRCDNCVIRNCKIEHMGDGGLWGTGIRLAWGVWNTLVEGNTINSTGRGGILCNDYSKYLTIRNNTVTMTGAGRDGDSLAIEVWGNCDYAIIEDNVIDRWLSNDGCNYSAIRRNLVSDKSGRIGAIGLEHVAANYCVWVDNTVDQGVYFGLTESNRTAMKYNYWGHTLINNTAQFGAEFSCGAAYGAQARYIYDLTITNTRSDTTLPYPYEPYGHALRFNGGIRGFVFENLTVKDNKTGTGVAVYGTADNIKFVKGTWEVTGNANNNIPDIINTNYIPLNVSITCPSEVIAGETVTFTAVNNSGTGIKHTLWDFSAGLPAGDNSNPKFTFDEPGNYRITLIVWDGDDGNGEAGRAEKWITVHPEYHEYHIKSLSVSGEDSIIADVLCPDQGGEAILIAAIYGGGKLLNMKTVPVTQSGKVVVDGITIPENADKIKAFIWTDIFQLKPLCRAKTLIKSVNSWVVG